jgi:hypothetical protein
MRPTNRLASTPRDSTALWSRPRESRRKGVEEPSLAGLYDINMMYSVLHPSACMRSNIRCGAIRVETRALTAIALKAKLAGVPPGIPAVWVR